MRRIAETFVIIALITLYSTGCSPTLKPSASDGYYEDLSLLRPVYTVPGENDPEVELKTASADPIDEPEIMEIQYDITHPLDSLLDSIAVNNQNIQYVQGYTIQVYTGSSQDEANEAKAKVYKALPGSRPQVTYDLPNYKVKVGKYYHRLEAQKEFAVIKKEFHSAILVPQQFRID